MSEDYSSAALCIAYSVGGLTSYHPSVGEGMEYVLERLDIPFALRSFVLLPEAVLHNSRLEQGIYEVRRLCIDRVVLHPVTVCRFCKDDSALRSFLYGLQDPISLDGSAMRMA